MPQLEPDTPDHSPPLARRSCTQPAYSETRLSFGTGPRMSAWQWDPSNERGGCRSGAEGTMMDSLRQP